MNGKSPALSTITHRRDFLVAAGAKKFVTHSLILQMAKRNSDHPAGPQARTGFTVTKRMGNAVIRNRIKRRLRAAAREIAPKWALVGHDYVIISRIKVLQCPFSELLRDMEFAFSRISANTVPSKPEANQ